MLNRLLFYPTEVVGVVTLFALLLKVRLPPTLCRLVGGLSLLALAVWAATSPEGWDYELFWQAGRDVWAGENPYASPHALNPPHALPLFALLALLPLPLSYALWIVLQVAGSAVLVAVAHSALRAQEHGGDRDLPPGVVAVLTGVVAFSPVNRFGINNGQLALLTTLALLAALIIRERRPLLAGAALAVSAIKPPTLLPFLVLFLRRRDRLAWVSMAAVGLGLALAAVGPANLVLRCRQDLHNIGLLQGEGRLNDYSYANSMSSSIVAMDHLLYRVGVRDREAIRNLALAAQVVLGAWVVWQVLTRLHGQAGCALLACYAALFLYHRTYDMIILVLPLLYCTGRARAEQGRERWLYVISAVAALLVLFARPNLLDEATLAARNGGPLGRVLEVLLLPGPAWCILLAMVSLTAAERPRAAPVAVPA